MAVTFPTSISSLKMIKDGVVSNSIPIKLNTSAITDIDKYKEIDYSNLIGIEGL